MGVPGNDDSATEAGTGGVVVRPGTSGDAGPMLALYQRSIRETAAGHDGYDAAQIDVWSAGLTAERVEAILTDTVVAVAQVNGAMAGFANLEWPASNGVADHGELDMLFVHPDHGGRGVGSALVAAIETAAVEAGLVTVRVDASLLAAPLFEKLGYTVDERYEKHHGGQVFANTWLSKDLGASPG